MIEAIRSIAAPPDRIFLLVGGRAWLRGLFEQALANLDEVL